jgi:TorA maturation chaperone TorD
MKVETNCNALEETALSRAVLYRYLADSMRHPSRRALTVNEWRGALTEALNGGGDAALASRAHDCLLRGADRGQVEADYGRIVGHTPRAGVPPYESEWLGAAGDLLQFHQMSDVSAFYTAYGLRLNEGCDERVDHISIELAFLQFLCAKEAYASSQQDQELLAAALDGQRRFLAEHVARWSPAFFHRIGSCGRGGFYEALSDLARGWIEAECRRLDVEHGDPTLAPGETSVSLEDTCVSCAHASSCVPGGAPAPEAHD